MATHQCQRHMFTFHQKDNHELKVFAQMSLLLLLYHLYSQDALVS